MLDASQQVMQAMTEFVEQGGHFIVGQQGWLAAVGGGVKLHTRFATGLCSTPLIVRR